MAFGIIGRAAQAVTQAVTQVGAGICSVVSAINNGVSNIYPEEQNEEIQSSSVLSDLSSRVNPLPTSAPALDIQARKVNPNPPISLYNQSGNMTNTQKLSPQHQVFLQAHYEKIKGLITGLHSEDEEKLNSGTSEFVIKVSRQVASWKDVTGNWKHVDLAALAETNNEIKESMLELTNFIEKDVWKGDGGSVSVGFVPYSKGFGGAPLQRDKTLEKWPSGMNADARSIEKARELICQTDLSSVVQDRMTRAQGLTKKLQDAVNQKVLASEEALSNPPTKAEIESLQALKGVQARISNLDTTALYAALASFPETDITAKSVSVVAEGLCASVVKKIADETGKPIEETVVSPSKFDIIPGIRKWRGYREGVAAAQKEYAADVGAIVFSGLESGAARNQYLDYCNKKKIEVKSESLEDGIFRAIICEEAKGSAEKNPVLRDLFKEIKAEFKPDINQIFSEGPDGSFSIPDLTGVSSLDGLKTAFETCSAKIKAESLSGLLIPDGYITRVYEAFKAKDTALRNGASGSVIGGNIAFVLKMRNELLTIDPRAKIRCVLDVPMVNPKTAIGRNEDRTKPEGFDQHREIFGDGNCLYSSLIVMYLEHLAGNVSEIDVVIAQIRAAENPAIAIYKAKLIEVLEAIKVPAAVEAQLRDSSKVLCFVHYLRQRVAETIRSDPSKYATVYDVAGELVEVPEENTIGRVPVEDFIRDRVLPMGIWGEVYQKLAAADALKLPIDSRGQNESRESIYPQDGEVLPASGRLWFNGINHYEVIYPQAVEDEID